MKKQYGITLIALIITIILMLILAGVVLNLTIGENGLFKTAKNAVNKWNNAEENEQKELDELYAYINGGKLPENTKNTEAGTLVETPDKWKTNTPAYVRTSDGKEVISSKKISTVQAVATGNGETVPVPLGFYYVGGTLNSGVVISDDSRDKNKYAGIEDVPAGAIYNDDGTVKTYTEAEYNKLSQEEKREILLGNQFVWIPVSINNYKKVNWGEEYYNAIWESETPTSELPQIQKYDGFYIGRYEAGTSNIKLSTGINFSGENVASDYWLNDDFSIRDDTNNTATGKITTKAGEIPYYHADYFTALKLSEGMYSTEYVQSGLVTGTMWDVMLKFIAGNDESIITSSNWGNYTDGNVTYTIGKGRYSEIDGGMNFAFTKSDGEYHVGIQTSGISEDVKKKNLYDIAGNLWEWTVETAFYNSEVRTYMVRSGSGVQGYCDYNVCYRVWGSDYGGGTDNGFRPVLYIK